MIGQVLGHYRIAERIGAGGMGVVYRAHDERLHRDVALKLLPGGALSDEVVRRRFRNEALALSRTTHPNIATIHDFDSEHGVDFLVMEYIPGPTLAEKLAGGPLPEPAIVRLGIQLADGLMAAHARGVVHRDLKPSNLKVTDDGRLKILDFGIARRQARSDDTTVADTEGRRPAGSLPYMAPEQIRGDPVDVRTDIHAAGAVLYEIATGRRAFSEENDVQLMHAILTRVPEPPTRVNPGVSAALDSIILKSLDKDPNCRYQSAIELQVDLQRLGRATDAAGVAAHSETKPPRRPARLMSWLPKSRPARAVGLLLGLAVLSWLAWPAVRRPEPPTVPSGSRLRLAVLPPQNLSGQGAVSEWPMLLQALVASELTGVQELGVLDPMSLNGLLQSVLGTSAPQRGSRLAGVLKKSGIAFAIDGNIIAVAGGYRLQWNLLDMSAGEITFSHRADVAGEYELAGAARGLAAALLDFLQLQALDASKEKDLRPWFSLRKQNIEAVKAFIQASQYIHRYEPGGEKYLRRAIELDPAFIAPRLWLISALVSVNRIEEARQHYARLLTIEPDASPFEQAMIGHAGALLKDDLPGQARHLEIALGYSPGNNILLINLAGVYVVTKECVKALDVLRPAVDARWQYPPLYTLWGWCGIETGHFRETRDVLETALTFTHVEPIVYGFLEAAALATGDTGAAARYGAEYSKNPEPRPPLELARAYERAGTLCLQSGKPAEAAALFEKVAALEPRKPEHHDRLGEALLQAGRPDEGARQYERALEVDARWAHAHLMLARISEQRDDVDGARRHYTAYLRLLPSGLDAEVARQRLDGLQRRPNR